MLDDSVRVVKSRERAKAVIWRGTSPMLISGARPRGTATLSYTPANAANAVMRAIGAEREMKVRERKTVDMWRK